MTSALVSGITLILCIAVFVFFCFKGKSPFIVALIIGVIISFTTQAGFFDSVFVNLPNAIGASFANTFWLFMSAGVLGEYYASSSFGKLLGSAILKKIPKRFAPYIVVVISALFNIASMPCHDWVVAAIAFPLMYTADMPLYLAFVANYGTTCVLAWTLPGYASIPNVMPAEIFGVTKLYYATGIGWTICILGMILVCLYLVFLTKQAQKKGIHYMETDSGKGAYTMVGHESTEEAGGTVKGIAAIHAFVPILIIIVASFVLNIYAGLGSTAAVVISQAIATIYIAIFGRGHFDDGKKHLDRILDATMRMVPVIITVGAISAFATLVSDTAAFSTVISSVFNLNLNPYLLIVIIVSVIAAITSDGIAAIITLGSTDIAARLIATGANPGALACLTRITCAGLDTLPWSTQAIIPLQVFGFNYKTGYKYTFAVTVALPLILAVIGMLMAMIIY